MADYLPLTRKRFIENKWFRSGKSREIRQSIFEYYTALLFENKLSTMMGEVIETNTRNKGKEAQR